MYDQPMGTPPDRPESPAGPPAPGHPAPGAAQFPSPPPLPPAPPGHLPPPHGHHPGQGPWQYPGYPPPVPAPSSRKGLWIALAVAGAVLVAGTVAVAATGGDDHPSAGAGAARQGPAGGSGGGTAPDAGQAPADGGDAGEAPADGGEAPAGAGPAPGHNRIALPSDFLGLPRQDDDPMFAQLKDIFVQSVEATPGAHADMAIYSDGLHMVTLQAAESDTAFPSQQEVMESLVTPPTETPGATILYDPSVEVDPGPQGGLMRCMGSTTKYDSAPMAVLANCMWVDDNTFGTYSEPYDLQDPDMSDTAAHARRIRAIAETPE